MGDSTPEARVREFLAKTIIIIYVSVTSLLFLFMATGLPDPDVAMRYAQAWTGAFSFLVGAVVAHYFGIQQAAAPPPPGPPKATA